MKHVVMFSAGGGSWAAARRAVERHGRDNLTLLFTDTLMEDEDAYRFLIEGAADVLGIEVPTQRVPQPYQFPAWTDRPAYKLFVDGLRREFADVLPKILKRQMADAWLKVNCDPAETIVYVGIDKFEEHRFDDGAGGGVRPRRAKAGWTYQAPLTEPPFMAPWDVRRLMQERGLKPPRLYGLGFQHNNCGGICVKAGHAQFALLHRTMPDRFAFAERREADFREMLGDVSILTDRSRDNVKKPLTLTAFRQRIEADPQIGLGFDDWNAGCGCFLEAAE